MATISYAIPAAGSTLNSIADPEVATALQTLLTWANGNIDTVNLSAAALLALKASGSWTAVTLAANVGAAAGAYTPSARVEGDIARLKGAFQNNTGGLIASGGTVFTVPNAAIPTSTVVVVATNQNNNAFAAIRIATSTGVATVLNSVGSTQIVYIDGITYSLS